MKKPKKRKMKLSFKASTSQKVQTSTIKESCNHSWVSDTAGIHCSKCGEILPQMLTFIES